MPGKIQKITPFLWFDTQAEEAANYYVSIFDNSRIVDVIHSVISNCASLGCGV